ncbi:MAG: HEAT repeat domain-containing protein [bacterium]
MTTIDLPFSGAVPLVLFLAKATLLLVGALLITIPLRRSTAGARHLVWLAVLVGVLALPLLSRVGALRVGVLPSGLATVPTTPPTPPTPATPRVRAPEATIAANGGASVAPVLAGGSLTYSTLTIIAVLWSAVALALVGWLAAGAMSVRRIVNEARELTSPDWTMPLCEVADRLDLDSPPRLVLSDRIEMAFACGVITPTIVLPANADSWSDDRRRAVLFHELAHVRRHDLLGHTLGRLACAVYWFHPLVWTAAKRLRAESERACDDLVLSCGARPSEYAQHLLDMVTSVRHHGAPVMALPMARKKEFEGRMLAILDPTVQRTSPGRMQAATVVATIAALSLSIAAVAPASAGGVASVASVAKGATAQRPQKPAPAPRAPSVKPMIALPVRAQSSDTGRIATLIRILSTDADATVRRTAAWGLEEIQSAGARAALITALRSDADGSVREMAAWALSEQAGEDAVSALSDGLHDKSAHVRATSAWALGQLDARREAGSLESAISDSAGEVREMAIWAIGQMNVRTAPRPMVNALTDGSSQVRLLAAWAIGEIADPSTADAVVSAFQTESDSQVRSAEIRALAEMGKTSQAVLDIAVKSGDPELRRRAVSMLAGGSGASWPWPWPWPQPRPSP